MGRVGPLDQLFSTGWILTPQGTIDDIWRHFDCHKREYATCIWWVEPKDSVEHPKMHKAVPITKIYPSKQSIVLTFRKPVLDL